MGIVTCADPTQAAMKIFLIVTLAAIAAGQQFQQQRQFNTAVRLASPGYFQQSGSSSSSSSQNNQNRFQANSFQSNNFRNSQGATVQSGSSSGSSVSSSGSLQNNNRNQFQSQSF